MLLASKVISIPSLWIATLLLAIFLPPAFYYVRHRREWFYSWRGLFLCFFIGLLSIMFLSRDIQTLWWYRNIVNYTISDYPWEVPLMIVICSSLVTFAMIREPIEEKSLEEDR